MTLEALVVSLFRSNQTNTPPFKALVNLYGKEKIALIWENSFRIQEDWSHPIINTQNGIFPYRRAS